MGGQKATKLNIALLNVDCPCPVGPRPPEGNSLADWIHISYRRFPNCNYKIVPSAELADILIFCEHDQKDEFPNRFRLKNDIRRFSRPLDSYVINYEDGPIPYAPGCYTSIKRSLFDPLCVRAAPYPLSVNPWLEEIFKQHSNGHANDEPKWLASFSGANTNPIRQRLFDLKQKINPMISLTETQMHLYFNAQTSDNRGLKDFARRILSSKFSLCPRGAATSTYRMYESMQLARAPVIIADDWVEPNKIDWPSCSIRLPEDQLEALPQLLQDHAHQWREMGLNARSAWEKNFGPDRIGRYLIDQIVELHQSKRIRYRAKAPLWVRPKSRLSRLLALLSNV